MNIDQAYKIIFEILEKKHCVSQMVDEISRKLDFSIRVIDLSGEVVYESMKEGAEQQFEEFSPLGEVVEEYNAAITQFKTWDKAEETTEVGNHVRVITPISKKGTVVAFCVSYHTDTSREDAYSLNRLVSRTIIMQYEMAQFFELPQNTIGKMVLGSFLFGENTGCDRIISNKQRLANYYLKPPFILVKILEQEHNQIELGKCRMEMIKRFPTVLTRINDGELVAVFSEVENAELKEEIWKQLEEFMASRKMIGIVTSVFSNVNSMKNKNDLLSDLYRIVKNKKIEKLLYKEEDYYLEMVCYYAYEKMGSDMYRNSRLEQLKKEDSEKGTHLYETLKVYLEAGGNVNIASQKLFIHRNTIIYRLARIQEMVDVDINDPEKQNGLLVSMIMREYDEKKYV